MSVTIHRVRFENHKTPATGIGESSPRISWSFDGTVKDWVQEEYEIEIQRNDNSVESLVVKSSASLLVPWIGTPLQSRERASIRVRATSTSGQTTNWSTFATVEAGFLSPFQDWNCSLIEPDGTYASSLPHRPVVFRGIVDSVTKLPHSARLYITAHGVYEAKINNSTVGDHVLAPGWTSYRNRLIYQTFDVTDLIKNGSNILEVAVGEGWYCGRFGFLGGQSNIYGNRIGLIAMLILEVDGGERIVLGTDDNWEWAYSEIKSSELYDGEVFDGRTAISSDTPWEKVKSKPISDTLVAPDGPPIRRIQEMTPVAVWESPSGKTIVDMGQNMVGWLRARISGPSGTTISFQFTEALEHGEVATRPLRHCKAKDYVTLSDQPITWEPKFTFHGFRYIQVDNWPGELQLSDLTGVVIHTDMLQTGSFACSNPLLNRLHENVIWSMKGNFVGIPTDCPQRDERLGWTGDLNLFSDTANYLFDTQGMLRSWLKDLELEQKAAGGIVPLIIPNIVDGFKKESHAVWGDVAVMLPWSLFQAFGDKEILVRQYSSMKSWIDAIPRRKGGLWNYKAEWKLGDWLDPAAPPEDAGNATTDPTLVSDAFLVHISFLISKISALVDDATVAQEYATQAENLRREFAFEYITPSGLLACDTQTALALAIHFSLFTTVEQEKRAAERLEHIIRANSRFKIATGFAGTPFVGHAMTKMGKSNTFYRMLLHRQNPSWLYPVTMGATTIWERWDSMLPDGTVNPGEMTSFNHYALGAVAAWMHRSILGLKIIEPGWRVFGISPVPGGGIRWAKGQYLSPYGTCTVRWTIEKDGHGELFSMNVGVPPNCRAEVRLPGKTDSILIGSGDYSWTIPYHAEEWPVRAIFPPTMAANDLLPDDEQIALE